MNQQFSQAFTYALEKHANQLRKGTKVLYITHPVNVAETLSYYYPEDRELHIAGLLHDVVEDTNTSIEEIALTFGQNVADLVWSVTKPPTSNDLPTEKIARWKAQRIAMLEHLKIDNKPVLRLKAADALANLKAILRDLQNPAIGEAIWTRFKVGKEESLWYYYQILEKVLQGIKGEPLLDELHGILKQVEEYSDLMQRTSVSEKIKQAFIIHGNPCHIPMQGGTFTANLREDGIEVDNLGNQPFLPWSVFEETVELLKAQGGKAKKGNAMSYRLGDPELGLDSIEGYIAKVVYKQKIGESVFRRITPISNILVWAKICESGRGILLLTDFD